MTLHQILVHMTAETHRHAGHADIIRELIDGAVGLRPDNDNMAPGHRSWWDEYRSRVQRVARQADSGSTDVKVPRGATSPAISDTYREGW